MRFQTKLMWAFFLANFLVTAAIVQLTSARVKHNYQSQFKERFDRQVEFLLMIIVIPASLVGSLALFVGMYLVMIIYMFATYHVLFQHYDLFLERGGEPIQIHPRVIGPPIHRSWLRKTNRS